MSPIKEILRLILVTLLPIAYITLKMKFPDFPLAQDTFVNLILWVIGLLIGGWQIYVAIKNLVFYYFGKKGL